MWREAKQILSFLPRESRIRYGLVAGMGLFSPALDLFSLSMLFPILDRAAAGGSARAAAFKLLLLGGLMLFKGLYELLLARLQASWQCDCNWFLAGEMYDMLLKEDLLRHNARNESQTLHCVRQDVGSAVLALACFKEIFLNGILLAGYTVLVFALSGPAGTLGVSILGVMMLLLKGWNTKRTQACGSEVRQREIALTGMTAKAYHAYKEVAMDADKRDLAERFSRAVQKKEAITKTYLWQQAVISVTLQNSISAVIFLLLAVILLSGFDAGKLVSMAVLLVAVLAKMIPAARIILLDLNQIHYTGDACKNLCDNCRHYRDLRAKEQVEEKGRYHPLRLEHALAVRDITFAYPGGPAVLEHAAMEIPAGATAALVGPSGGGKTTLLDLLAGLLKPQGGAILYDDYDIVKGEDSQGPCRTDIGTLVSYMPQAPAYWEGSVKDCVAYRATTGTTDANRVVGCLKTAMLYDEIAKMPQGIDTVLGADGLRLSGGQYQRLGIARALYKDPKLLILDEGTASLDADVEAAVFRALKSGRAGRTILLATHHQSLAERCDRVYEIKGRRIIRRK